MNLITNTTRNSYDALFGIAEELTPREILLDLATIYRRRVKDEVRLEQQLRYTNIASLLEAIADHWLREEQG